ncbi:MAG TPA: hypothetical protein VFM40_05030 [Actinomycetota bacterium]|nr:hypothetical protein [Actinomycetota bacterium]
MRELEGGLWHWQAPHPDWTPQEPWPQEVSSYAIDDGARVLLFDPLAVPNEILELAADREPIVVLTAPWHERDTRTLVERLGVPVFVPAPDTADDLVRKFGITPRRRRAAAPTSPGSSPGTSARPTCTRPAIGFRSGSRRSSAGSTTTSCSGSSIGVR